MSKILCKRSVLLVFIFGLIICQTGNQIVNAVPNHFSNYSAIIINKENVSHIAIEQVYDSANTLHLILILWFSNDTYKLLNYWNGQYSIIDSGVSYGAEIIKVITLNEGIGVFYIDSDNYYNRILKFYKWSETSEEICVVSSYSSVAYVSEFFIDYFDGIISVFWVNDVDYVNENSNLTYITIDPKNLKVSIISNYVLPLLPYYIKGVYFGNDSLFVISLQEAWINTTYRTIILTQRLFPNNTLVNCTTFILFRRYYSSITFTRVEGSNRSDLFYVVFTTMDEIHTKRLFIGENKTFEGYASFLNGTNQTPMGYYLSDPIVKAYENVSFIALCSIDYFFETSSNQNKKVNIVFFTEKGNSFLRNEIVIGINGQSTNFQKWFDLILVDQKGNFTATYAQILDDSQFPDNYLAKELIDIEIASSFLLPEIEPIFMELKILSNWAYFWRVNWPIFVGVISFIVVIYAVFHKRINKFIRKIKKYLLRPIIETESKTKLILINLWLFITGSLKLVWWLWSSNKKRVIVSILGMTIIVSTITLSILTTESKFGSMVAARVDNSVIANNWYSSVDWSYTLSSGSSFIYPNSENWTDTLVNDMMGTFMQNAPTYASLIDDYSVTVSIPELDFSCYNLENDSIHWSSNLLGYTHAYSVLISNLLAEGRVPQNPNEIVVSAATQEVYGLKIGDTLKLYANLATRDKYYNMTIVGFFHFEAPIQVRELAQKLGLSGDLFSFLDGGSALVPIQHFGTILDNIDVSPLLLKGQVQFIFDFAGKYSQSKAEQLGKDLEKLSTMGSISFSFGEGTWEYNDELSFIVIELNSLLISAKFSMLVLLVPLLYLGIFLVTETSALFRASYNKEIEILSSKGMSIGRIATTYTLMKILESIIAILLSIVIVLVTLPTLVKIDTFLTFNDSFAKPNLHGLIAAIPSSFVFLLLITVPDMIKLSIRRRRAIKEPKRFIKFLKKFQLLNIFYIGTGSLLCYLFFYLSDMISLGINAVNNLILTILQYLFAVALMLVFLGLGLLIRDLHKLLLMFLSKVAWKIKKSKIALLLVNIRSDIDLFNKHFLTWMLLIWLIVPAILFPINIQHQMINEAKFYHNADIVIPNADLTNQSSINEFVNELEVEAWTSVIIFKGSYKTLTFTLEVINNTEAYHRIAYSPPKEYVNNWDKNINSLSENNTMLVSEKYFTYVAGGQPEIMFDNVIFNITGTFKLFPGYQVENEFVVVTSLENSILLMPALSSIDLIDNSILIKLKNSEKQESFVIKLKEKYGIQATSFEGYYYDSLFSAFPIYPLLTTEYILTILICLTTILFISITAPLKTLLYRINKHDVLKKIGIPTHTIIFQTIAEHVIASLFIGIIIGYIGAKILLHYMTSFVLVLLSDLSFNIHDPIWATLLIFVIFPLMFIGIFAVTMANNFRKYRPINLE
ncbi:MAG: hypothetical protein ACTSYN_00320 [Candidatus Heimdallarchaeaceae archaeon]